MKHTQETLQQLSEDELTRICAEVCYGWRIEDSHPNSYFHGWYNNKSFVMGVRRFNPLENSEKGRSQAFELAVKFDCFPNQKMFNDLYTIFVYRVGEWVHNEDPQAAIVIAAILTAQTRSYIRDYLGEGTQSHGLTKGKEDDKANQV